MYIDIFIYQFGELWVANEQTESKQTKDNDNI